MASKRSQFLQSLKNQALNDPRSGSVDRGAGRQQQQAAASKSSKPTATISEARNGTRSHSAGPSKDLGERQRLQERVSNSPPVLPILPTARARDVPFGLSCEPSQNIPQRQRQQEPASKFPKVSSFLPAARARDVTFNRSASRLPDKDGEIQQQEQQGAALNLVANIPDARGFENKVNQWIQKIPAPEVENPDVTLNSKALLVRRNLFTSTQNDVVNVDCEVVTSLPPGGAVIASGPAPSDDELLSIPLSGNDAASNHSSSGKTTEAAPGHTQSFPDDAATAEADELDRNPANDFALSMEHTDQATPAISLLLETPRTGAAETPTVTPEHSNATSSQRKRTRASGASSESPKRKRSRNQFRWKATVRKQLKNLGQPYTSAKGKEMKGAEMRGACSCTFNCRHKVTEEQRKKIFEQFWAIGNHERQWEYIRQNSDSKSTNNKKNSFAGKKKNSRKFFLMVQREVDEENETDDVAPQVEEMSAEKITVCKKMFMATLGIWDSWIDSAYKHLNAKKGNITTPDKRGRHANHPKAVTPEKIETVKEHCNLFPRVPSHYCREKSKREYLEHGLSLTKMAKLYIKWAEEKGLPKTQVATIRQYKDVVNTSFNIGFFKPKKDQCALCALFRSKHNPRHIKERYKNLYAAHIKRKQLVKKIKQRDRAAAEKDKNLAVISFDLQKQLPCPRSEVGSFYYRNKLTVLNFTIFHEVERVGHCYIWHEGLAKKGSSEVASSLSNFIDKLVEKGHKELIFYSDNCSGQNKNRFVFAMFQHKAVLHGIKITHRFLEPGHTHMDADTIHARIENSTNLKEIMDFEDWITAITEAKEELPPYNVIRLKQSLIFDYKDLVSKQNWKTDLKRNDVKWSKVREVSIDGKESNLVRLRYDLDGEIFTLSPNRVGRPVELKTYQPPKQYNGPVPLTANKRADIEALLAEMAIPFDKQQFFRDVLDNTVDDGGDGLDEVEYETDEEIIASIDPNFNEDNEKEDEGEDNDEDGGEDEGEDADEDDGEDEEP